MAEEDAPKPAAVFVPRPETIQDMVRRLARDTSNIKWSRHALQRMDERGITDKYAIDVLRRGSITERSCREGRQPRRMESEDDVSSKRASGGRRCGDHGPQRAPICQNRGMGRPEMTMLLQKGICREVTGEPLHYTACGLDDVYLVNGFTR